MVELGTRCTTERVHVGNSPPKVARAVFLPDVQHTPNTSDFNGIESAGYFNHTGCSSIATNLDNLFDLESTPLRHLPFSRAAVAPASGSVSQPWWWETVKRGRRSKQRACAQSALRCHQGSESRCDAMR